MASALSDAVQQVQQAVSSVLNPPSESSSRKIEHAVCLCVAAYAAKTAIQLGPKGVVKAVLTKLLPALELVPGVGELVAAEEAKALESIEQEMLGDGDADALTALPQQGLSADEVLQRAKSLQAADLNDEAQVKKWGGVYHINTAEHADPLFDLQADVWKLFNATNALYPMVFKAVRKFQAEIVEMVLNMVRSKDAAGVAIGQEVGLLTSGGTESICLAMYALKKFAAKTRGVQSPEIIACDSAHGALDKACAYFDIKLVKVQPGDDFRMRVQDVKKHLNANTICVYTSAPSFPHGVMDPIADIGALCATAGVPVHVDNCMGGIVASMLKQAGLLQVEFDFNVPGVSTMSVDCHKFGQASKGASVVAFRNNAIRQCSYTPVLDWSGGFYVTPTMQGSRNGAIIASAWATLVHKGADGYMTTSKNVHATLQRGIAAVEAIPQLKVAGNPDMCMLPMVWADPGEAAKIYAVAAGMGKRGWSLATLQRPACINITVAEQYMWSLDAFITDLKEVAAEVQKVPLGELSGVAGVYGSAAVMPDDKMESALMSFCDMQMKVKPLLQ